MCLPVALKNWQTIPAAHHHYHQKAFSILKPETSSLLFTNCHSLTPLQLCSSQAFLSSIFILTFFPLENPQSFTIKHYLLHPILLLYGLFLVAAQLLCCWQSSWALSQAQCILLELTLLSLLALFPHPSATGGQCCLTFSFETNYMPQDNFPPNSCPFSTSLPVPIIASKKAELWTVYIYTILYQPISLIHRHPLQLKTLLRYDHNTLTLVLSANLMHFLYFTKMLSSGGQKPNSDKPLTTIFSFDLPVSQPPCWVGQFS